MIIDFSYCNLMAILALELLARKADTDSKIKSGYSTIQKNPPQIPTKKYPPESVLRELFLLPFVVRPLSLQMSIYSILSIFTEPQQGSFLHFLQQCQKLPSQNCLFC